MPKNKRYMFCFVLDVQIRFNKILLAFSIHYFFSYSHEPYEQQIDILSSKGSIRLSEPVRILVG